MTFVSGHRNACIMALPHTVQSNAGHKLLDNWFSLLTSKYCPARAAQDTDSRSGFLSLKLQSNRCQTMDHKFPTSPLVQSYPRPDFKQFVFFKFSGEQPRPKERADKGSSVIQPFQLRTIIQRSHTVYLGCLNYHLKRTFVCLLLCC